MAEAGALVAVTRDGVAYDPGADAWSIPTPGGPVRFDHAALAAVSASLREGMKCAMAASLATLPTRTVHGDFSSLRALFRYSSSVRPDAVLDEVTPALLSDYEASLPAGSRHRAGRLAAAMRRWAATGAGGLSRDLAGWLAWAPAEAHVAGLAVKTCCPKRGALSAATRDALLGALHADHRSGRLPLADYAMALLVAVLALRPLQVACLKVGDLRPPSDPSAFAADLLVARLKQRGVVAREAFATRGLVGALADVLRRQCAAAARLAKIEGRFPGNAPIFPAGSRAALFAPGFEGHPSPSAISRRISATLDRLMPTAGGEAPAHVFPLRLRRTLPTTLRDEGCDVPVLSVLLDHTGRYGALAYLDASADLGVRLGPCLSGILADFGARFRRPTATGSDL